MKKTSLLIFFFIMLFITSCKINNQLTTEYIKIYFRLTEENLSFYIGSESAHEIETIEITEVDHNGEFISTIYDQSNIMTKETYTALSDNMPLFFYLSTTIIDNNEIFEFGPDYVKLELLADNI